MPGGLDSVGRSVALDLIDQFGTVISFTYVTDEGDYDPSDGSVTGRTEATSNAKALVKEPEEDYAKGDVVDQDAVTLLIPAADIAWTPTKGTRATFNGKEYTAWKVDPVQPGVLPILYKLHMIRGSQNPRER